MLWSLKDSKREHVARATFAEDDETGHLSMLVTHRSRNLKELSKCQTLNVKAFYNADENTKIFGELDPLDRAVHSVGVKLREVNVNKQRFMSEISYSPSGDTASTKLEFGDGDVRVATTLSFAQFTKSQFAKHKEAIEVKAKVSKDTKLSGKYDLSKKTLKTKATYVNGPYTLEGEVAIQDNSLANVAAKVDKALKGGNKAAIMTNLTSKRGALEYKNRANNLPFSLVADFPFDADRNEILDNTSITFRTRINVFNQ
mmetsp:Transcript_7375/g.22471  ORF Transcript_7375/g.22471 Transcript_7375/m.22471 type:complete len:257 (+) Transcript_7375:148-918(+)